MKQAGFAGAATEPLVAPLDRHTLVWIKPSERANVYQRAPAGARDALQRWFANDWPLVVRRSDSVSERHVPLGLPLPPSEGKQRLCFEVDNRAIGCFGPPLRLRKAALSLPDPWRRPLLALAKLASKRGVALQVYGSVAWQALTGLVYLTAQSDVDLLWHPRDASQLEAVLRLVRSWEARYRMRADGEVVFPDGAAVAWREWETTAATERVLVKRARSANLVPRTLLARTLGDCVPRAVV